MSKLAPSRYFKTSPEIIRLGMMLHARFPLSLHVEESLFHERGIDVSHEAVCFCWKRCGRMSGAEIRRWCDSRLRACREWCWHLDEVFVKICGEAHYLWRTIGHEGGVPESVVTKSRDRRADVRF